MSSRTSLAISIAALLFALAVAGAKIYAAMPERSIYLCYVSSYEPLTTEQPTPGYVSVKENGKTIVTVMQMGHGITEIRIDSAGERVPCE